MGTPRPASAIPPVFGTTVPRWALAAFALALLVLLARSRSLGGGAGGGSAARCDAAAAATQAAPDVCFDVVAFHAAHSGEAEEAAPPKRRKGFKPPSNENKAKYDSMWSNSTGAHGYKQNSCWGCRFVGDVVSRVPFQTALDAGTGNGQLVRALRARGKAAWGVELSSAVLQQDAPDLLAKGWVEQGSLTDLPFEDKQFDLVFSADVLEHIMPDQAEAVAAELVRVAKRHIVTSISLKSHGNEALHSLLRPRTWWDELFARHGARPNRALVWALQQREASFPPEQLSDCRQEGDEADGGKFEVCVVQQPWLVGAPGQELRQTRGFTPADGALEPWFFAYTLP